MVGNFFEQIEKRKRGASSFHNLEKKKREVSRKEKKRGQEAAKKKG